MKRSILYILVSTFFFFTSCECEDCGPLVSNPVFKARFINTDSLNVLTDSLDGLTNSSTFLQDTINGIDQILNSTEDTDSVLTFTSLKESYESEKTIIDSLLLIIEDKEDSVSDGLNVIERLTNLDNGNSFIPDTLSPHLIPLPPAIGLAEARYELIIDERQLRLGVSFEAEESINDLDEVLIITSEITIDETYSTFDSVYLINEDIFVLEF